MQRQQSLNESLPPARCYEARNPGSTDRLRVAPGEPRSKSEAATPTSTAMRTAKNGSTGTRRHSTCALDDAHRWTGTASRPSNEDRSVSAGDNPDCKSGMADSLTCKVCVDLLPRNSESIHDDLGESHISMRRADASSRDKMAVDDVNDNDRVMSSTGRNCGSSTCSCQSDRTT